MHYDPYDVTRIWVRNHHDGGWMTVHWSHLSAAPAPFGEQAWRQAQQVLTRRGEDPTQEAGIAAAVATLLDKAEAGPTPPATRATGTHGKSARTKRDRRVAARTRATTAPTWPRPVDQHTATDRDDVKTDLSETPAAPSSDGLAEVIPLEVFNARDEAKKWW